GGQQCRVPEHVAQRCRQGVPVLVGDQPAAVAEDLLHLADDLAGLASQSHCHIRQPGHRLDIASPGEDGGLAGFELVCVEVVRHLYASAHYLAAPATPTPATCPHRASNAVWPDCGASVGYPARNHATTLFSIPFILILLCEVCFHLRTAVEKAPGSGAALEVRDSQ